MAQRSLLCKSLSRALSVCYLLHAGLIYSTNNHLILAGVTS